MSDHIQSVSTCLNIICFHVFSIQFDLKITNIDIGRIKILPLIIRKNTRHPSNDTFFLEFPPHPDNISKNFSHPIPQHARLSFARALKPRRRGFTHTAPPLLKRHKNNRTAFHAPRTARAAFIPWRLIKRELSPTDDDVSGISH